MKLLNMLCKQIGVEIEEVWKGNDGHYYKIDEEGYLLTSCADESGTSEYMWEAVSFSIPRLLRGELKPFR